MTSTKVIDDAGVVMDGPDRVGTAAGVAEGVGGVALLSGASVGTVAPAQAGILPMSGPVTTVTDRMVEKGMTAYPGLDPAVVRSILEAALRG